MGKSYASRYYLLNNNCTADCQSRKKKYYALKYSQDMLLKKPKHSVPLFSDCMKFPLYEIITAWNSCRITVPLYGQYPKI